MDVDSSDDDRVIPRVVLEEPCRHCPATQTTEEEATTDATNKRTEKNSRLIMALANVVVVRRNEDTVLVHKKVVLWRPWFPWC